MKKLIVVLKGNRNTGKSDILGKYLKELLGIKGGKKIFLIGNRVGIIIVMSIQEYIFYKNTLKKLISDKYDIVILASWIDEIILQSKYFKSTIKEYLDNNYKEKYTYKEFYTQKVEANQIKNTNKEIARQIYNTITKK